MSRFLVIVGENKTGKTTLAMTSPGKIGWMEFDVGGVDRAAWRFPDIREKIVLKQYVTPLEEVKLRLGLVSNRKHIESVTGMAELWQQIVDDYFEFLEDPEIQTIVVDPYPQLWKINTASLLQEKQEDQIKKSEQAGYVDINLRERLKQIEYGPVSYTHLTLPTKA